MNGIPRELMQKINECAQRHGLSTSEYFIAVILAELTGSGIESEEIKSDSLRGKLPQIAQPPIFEEPCNEQN
jgi:hypothetical protein